MATTSTRPKNPFLTLLSGSEPKQQQVQWAVLALQEMLDRPQNQRQAELWAQILAPIPGEKLAMGFLSASLTVRAWPSLPDIVEPIFEAEYAEEFDWLLHGLREFGWKWQGRPPLYGERTRKPGAGIDDWEDGPLLRQGQAAPKIRKRLFAALQRVGGSNVENGLYFVSQHPGAHSSPLLGEDVLKIKFQIEREFKAAWMSVRKLELGEGDGGSNRAS